MFAKYHMIQFTLHCLITKTEGHPAQTAMCTLSFVTEQYESTNCLQPSVQLTTLVIALKHITIYYCHNQLHSLCCLTYKSHSWH